MKQAFRLAAALAVLAAVGAAKAAGDDPLRLPDLRVTGEALEPAPDPASVSRVDADEVRAGLGLSLDSALGEVAGVPLTLSDGQTELDALDLGRVESVHVNRGTAAAPFGNAAGGVVSIRTRRPGDGPRWQLSAGAGAFGLLRARAETGGEATGGHWSGSIQRAQLDGYRAHAEYRSSLLDLQSLTALGGGELQLGFSALDVTARDPGGLNRAQRAADRRQAAPNNLRFDAGEAIEQQRLSARWLFGRDADHSFSGFIGRRRFANRLPFESGGQVRLDRAFGGLSAATGFDLGGADWPQRLEAGADWQWQRDRRERYDNLDGQRGDRALFQHEHGTGIGLYLQHALALGERWSLHASVRYDWLRLSADDRFGADGDDSGARRFADPSASLALAWRPLPRLQAFLRAAGAYESPTQTELANPDGGGFNPALEAARSGGLELGLVGGDARLHWQAVIYRIGVREELIPFEDANQPGRTFFRNAGRSRRDGVELSVRARPARNWSLGAAATLGDYRFREYLVDGQDRSGNRLPGVPSRHGRIDSRWRFGDHALRLDWELVGPVVLDDANADAVGGYGLLHLRFDGALPGGALRWHAGVRNLLDRDYDDNLRINAFGGRHFEPAAGATAYAGIEWSGG